MTQNPIDKFSAWLEDAGNCKAIADPTAMTLATADAQGKPSARIVLLKGHDGRGFVFYTNLDSRKSVEIKANPYAALCFYWPPLERQARIEGAVEAVSNAEADAYYASRPRESRIGAWASQQSHPLPNREELVKAVEENTRKFAGRDVPRPAFWSGWRVIPEMIEFWQQGDFRLHDRELFIRKGKEWNVQKLYP